MPGEEKSVKKLIAAPYLTNEYLSLLYPNVCYCYISPLIVLAVSGSFTVEHTSILLFSYYCTLRSNVLVSRLTDHTLL